MATLVEAMARALGGGVDKCDSVTFRKNPYNCDPSQPEFSAIEVMLQWRAGGEGYCAKSVFEGDARGDENIANWIDATIRRLKEIERNA